MRSFIRNVAATAVVFLAATAASAQSRIAARHWAGTATVKGQQVPVQLNLASPGAGGAISGSFVNGQETARSSSGQISGGHLLLAFDYYGRKLEGDLHDGQFTGTLSGRRMKVPYPVTLHPDRDGKPATRFVTLPGNKAQFSTINGDWEIALNSRKGEAAWTLRVSPFSGNGEIKAVILRIDGDTGGLYGSFDTAKGEFRVSRFGPFGAELYSLRPQPDGTLQVADLLAGEQWTARRSNEARKENLAPPTRSTDQTTVVDPSQPFQFSAPNLAGQAISSSDPEFRGKVVIVAIGGSWCPNCHDEAPFLVDLYNRYHARGLEIVNLSFEEDDQLANPERLRAFVTRYHIPYTVLVAGTPDQLAEKIPQGKNLNCWPTTFFLGRDGLVKETHAGFSGPATGSTYVELKAETSRLIEKLLADKQQPVVAQQ